MIWVILLAGGSGTRLAHESVRRYGYARPKQFCDFGGGSLLELTLARARRFAPDQRIVVITTRSHRDDALTLLGRHPRIVHVEQPRNRDTTSGLLLPLLHIRARDPDATVIVMPTDHALANDDVFGGSLQEALALVADEPEQIALLAADPCEHDDGYGWIVPDTSASRHPSVALFREKPTRAEIATLRAAGALVNTFVFVARASTLERAFAQHAPDCLRRLWAATHDPATLDATFKDLPSSSFSRDVLERIPGQLRIVALPRAAGWSDIGTPERLAAVGWNDERRPHAQGRNGGLEVAAQCDRSPP